MLHPRFDEKGFENAPTFGSILENTPCVGAIAPSLVLESSDRLEESCAILWADLILDRHQHRPAIARYILRGDRHRPMHGR